MHVFVLPKRRPGQCFLFRWRARERVVSGPDRPNVVPSYPAPPRPSPPPRRAPPRPDRPVVYPGFGFDKSCKACSGNFRMTDDSMYPFRPNANHKAVPGTTSSSMGVCASVVLFHGCLCFRPLGVGFCAKLLRWTPWSFEMTPRHHGGVLRNPAGRRTLRWKKTLNTALSPREQSGAADAESAPKRSPFS